MTGRIMAVKVGFTVETPEGSQRTMVDLTAMRRYARPERVDELIEDLTLICEDVTKAWSPTDTAAR